MEKKLRVGVVGCTGMVGQRFITLLENHPYFDLTLVAASKNSSGKTYEEAVKGRWNMKTPIPEMVKKLVVKDASDIDSIKGDVDFILCAVNMNKDEIIALEEAYAKAEIPVVSNNSAHRKTPDVPMVIPEINNSHIDVIPFQKKRLGTTKGFIAVKPNCSIQSYVPLLSPLMKFGPKKVVVSTYQAISGAGKTFESWPEMVDNVIPYIGGEEEKSEKEPLKVWGRIEDGVIKNNEDILITSQCIRVPVTDGHLATTFVTFENKPTKEEILDAWKNYKGRPQELKLHSAPRQFITYFEEDNRPQTNIDRDIEKGMGITAGRLREDSMFDYKFVGLSHNTLRGAAGGSLLLAELLFKEGYLY
ncbi:MAG: aspartate-semialdehyde dehydrogenase [Ruminococcaceae bacterium]|nr:aspartate-semialdehyde dehydrogenase [Oscillospiraceae bacterium]